MKSLRKLGEPQKTLVELGLILLCVVLFWQGLWFSLSIYLRTDHPIVIVAIDMSPWYVTSMTPTLGAGDILIIEGVDPSTLRSSTSVGAKDGDVIVFRHPYDVQSEWDWWKLRSVEEPILIVHRVIAKQVSGNITYLNTKGDYNNEEDPYSITGNAVVGKWTGIKLPLIGLVFLAAQDAIGRTIIITALVFMLLYEILTSTRKSSQDGIDHNVQTSSFSSWTFEIQVAEQISPTMASVRLRISSVLSSRSLSLLPPPQ